MNTATTDDGVSVVTPKGQDPVEPVVVVIDRHRLRSPASMGDWPS